MLKLRTIEAFDGDCILISFSNNNRTHNILIDGGINRTYVKSLRNILNEIKVKGNFIDLLIVTHIHDDHIGGIIEFYRDINFDKNIVKKVWFNSKALLGEIANDLEDCTDEISLSVIDNNKMGIRSGNTLERILKQHDSWQEIVIQFGEELEIEGAKITVINPRLEGIKALKKVMRVEEDESALKSAKEKDYHEKIADLIIRDFNEDKSDTNRTSIAFIFECANKKVLLLGDAWPSDIVSSLENLGYSKENKLRVDYVKISHHASKKNTNNELLDLLDCQNFIISTDGSKHGLPNKEALARIIVGKNPVNLYFNYDIYKSIFTAEEIQTYNFQCFEMKEIEV
ncbi:ComEC/Rec2 family competence protein [Alkalicoccobacillus gibsonii]|uniref:ComEC/Rec2 family competence protein n=1 Tax=Alkalicoccobacillus gibsonii TaxID=79881 RepID=UPI003518621A